MPCGEAQQYRVPCSENTQHIFNNAFWSLCFAVSVFLCRNVSLFYSRKCLTSRGRIGILVMMNIEPAAVDAVYIRDDLPLPWPYEYRELRSRQTLLRRALKWARRSGLSFLFLSEYVYAKR